MRNYSITVNGKVYSVSVEDAAHAAQAPRPAYPSQSAPAAPAPKAGAPETIVTSPITGTVMTVRVKAGDKVKEGELMLSIAEGTSETEILAPISATVIKTSVAPGTKVNAGDSLVVF